MQTMKQFVRSNRIRLDFVMVDSNPNMLDSEWRADHYKCVLKMGRKQMTTYFSMGIAICADPTAEDLLGSLASESDAIYVNFEDWCYEYGYDSDSRKMEKIYQACVKQSKKLASFLGSALFDELRYQTEAL